MQDVAKLAGVSKMTVSRAMRMPDLVQPDTLAHIRAIVESVGYVPNRVAGSLSSSRTHLMALIVPSLRHALYSETIQGISDALEAHDLQLLIADSGYSLEREEKAIAAFIAQRVCGLILHNTRHTARAVQMVRDAGIPCVETGNLPTRPIDMAVSYSNHEAGKAMAEYLLARGYRRFGFASLPVAQSERLRARRNGFLAGLRKAGITVPAPLVVEVGEGLESGSEALIRILSAEARVEAVFFAGDLLAAGAVFEAQRRGIRVPQDLAVAASDDNEIMQCMNPSLTTVRFPRQEIGRRSAQAIIRRMAGTFDGPLLEDLGFEIMARESA